MNGGWCQPLLTRSSPFCCGHKYMHALKCAIFTTKFWKIVDMDVHEIIRILWLDSYSTTKNWTCISKYFKSLLTCNLLFDYHTDVKCTHMIEFPKFSHTVFLELIIWKEIGSLLCLLLISLPIAICNRLHVDVSQASCRHEQTQPANHRSIQQCGLLMWVTESTYLLLHCPLQNIFFFFCLLTYMVLISCSVIQGNVCSIMNHSSGS